MKVVLERLSSCPIALNRELYKAQVRVVGARLPATSLAAARTTLPKEAWLNIPRIKPIILDPKRDPSVRMLLLDYKEHRLIPKPIHDTLNGDCGMIELMDHCITLDYDYWTADDILHASLPDDVVVPSGFEIVGHIAHLNLQDEHQPYKALIGQVILDKNRSLRTVVAKVGTIDSKFRFFDMDLLAGEPDYVAEVKQGDCRFRFDYSKVYWNTRLQHEHDRIVEKYVGKGDVVFDVFAGVGPFAIPAAKRGAIVHANDLNPHSYHALMDNCKLNKTTGVTAYNMDGRDFIRKSQEIIIISANQNTPRRHYIMNLPALAAEFCDAFQDMHWPANNNPNLIHCYMFCKPGERCINKVHLSGGVVEVVEEHLVRSVAPNKDMYCLSFKYHNTASDCNSDGDCKRTRLEV